MVFRLTGISKTQKDMNSQRYIRMRSRRDGHCAECEQDIVETEFIIWDTQEFKTYCLSCGEDLK
jgi:hypothetical protein